jgi:predicted RecA/RadA family phage recombinase
VADDYLPKFKPGAAITRTASGTVTAGQLVTVAGAVAVADSVTWLGVASRSVTTGQTMGVYTECVQRLTASAAITAGDRVKCAAAGKIATLTAGTDAYDRLVGIALEAASVDGDIIAVKMAR